MRSRRQQGNFLCAALSADTRVVPDRRLDDVDRQVKLENYCRTMISGSALSGTRRHCALSSASKRQTSPPADISNNPPRSNRHIVGANAAIAGSQRGLRNTWKLSAVASVLVKVRPQIDWPLPRTIAQSPIIWSIDFASERAAARFCRM